MASIILMVVVGFIIIAVLYLLFRKLGRKDEIIHINSTGDSGFIGALKRCCKRLQR